MKTENTITVEDFCMYHNVEHTFISYLHEEGVIAVETVNHQTVIPADEIRKLEKLTRLHTQLEINPPGISVVNNLLRQLEDMQQKMSELRSRLRLYEH